MIWFKIKSKFVIITYYLIFVNVVNFFNNCIKQEVIFETFYIIRSGFYYYNAQVEWDHTSQSIIFNEQQLLSNVIIDLNRIKKDKFCVK